MRFITYLVLSACLLCASSVSAQQRDYFLPQPAVQKYVVILAGAAIEERYKKQIESWALGLHDVLTEDYRYEADQIVLLMDQADPADARIYGSSRAENIGNALQSLKEVVNPGDQLFIFLLGHGTSDEEAAKFVIRGRDITAREVASGRRHFEQWGTHLLQEIIRRPLITEKSTELRDERNIVAFQVDRIPTPSEYETLRLEPHNLIVTALKKAERSDFINSTFFIRQLSFQRGALLCWI